MRQYKFYIEAHQIHPLLDALREYRGNMEQNPDLYPVELDYEPLNNLIGRAEKLEQIMEHSERLHKVRMNYIAFCHTNMEVDNEIQSYERGAMNSVE